MNKKNRSVMKALTMISQFSINMIVPIFMCTFIGIQLDKWLGTSFIAVVLFFLGAAAGFRNIVLMARDIYKDDEDRQRKH